MNNIMIFIPTYNEAENIVELLEKIFKINKNFFVLIVDDNSPDGTALIVKERYNNNNVKVIIRKGERGRGLAGIEGFKEFLNSDKEVLVEMDGDGSHSPEFIPDLLLQLKDYDLVLGSRFVNGGKDKERGAVRSFISFFARQYISFALNLKVNDITSGFRCFKKDVIKSIIPYLNAKDPFIVTESLYWASKHGYKIKEIPIYFYNRKKGKSKLSSRILFTYLFKVFKLSIIGKRLSFFSKNY